MMDILEYIRREIKKRGFMTATQIFLELNKQKQKLNLNDIICDEIYKIEYTNQYVSEYKLKDLYFYNPHIRKRKGKKKKCQKKIT